MRQQVEDRSSMVVNGIPWGTRRTVCFSETRLFGRLEFAGKFGVPQLVTINRLASYGVRWNRTRAFVPVVSTPRDPGLPW